MSTAPRELTAEQLRRVCTATDLAFQSTAELEPLNEIIGQERATRAIEFGLDIPSYGYNIYALGPAGAGKTTTIARYLERKAAGRPVPNDWGYVHNFVQPGEPQSLRLPPGGGRALRDRFDLLLKALEQQVTAAFESDTYAQHRKSLVEGLEQRRQSLMDDMEAFAQTRGFTVLEMPSGLLVAPVIDGKAASNEQFEQLPVEQQQALNAKEPELREHMEKVLRELSALDEQMDTVLDDLDRDMAAATIGPSFDALQAEYAAWPEVVAYLVTVRDHLSRHIDGYKPEPSGDGETGGSSEQAASAALLLGPPPSRFEHYRINVVVDNAGASGAPVVVETNPTYYNLIGRIEQKAQLGALITDYSLIKSGSLLRANGGYLVVDARALLRQPQAFDALKRSLRHQQVKIEEPDVQSGAIATTTLSPQPIPLDVKVILIGDPYSYYLLYAYDDEFQKLFKVRADFAGEMVWSEDNIGKIARFIQTRCLEEGLPAFDTSGVAKVVEYSSRLVEDQRKLTTRFAHVADLVREAAYWARHAAREAGLAEDQPLFVTAQDVQQAINERRYRSGLVEERVREAIVDDTVMIDVSGEKVGQVNGLAVLALGDTEFGKPTRITAKTFLGQGGVVNIEREAKLSGKVHDKGMLILSGYLGGRYAQDKPLSLSATITFEQSYDGVDGDSASSSELYVLLSSLSGLPINQGLAVTGSVNQHGEIQAIGGATVKIEGFFDVCREKGLTGRQGVVMPTANAATLMLREDVVEAVDAGQFHIYTVDTIDEGISLLTGVPAGERGPDGRFPEGTVNRRVDDALRTLALRLKSFGKLPAKDSKTSAGHDDEDDGPQTPREPDLPGDQPEAPELPDDAPDAPEDDPDAPPGDEPELPVDIEV